MNEKIQEMRENLCKSFAACETAFSSRLRSAQSGADSSSYLADIIDAAHAAGRCDQIARILRKDFGDDNYIIKARDMLEELDAEAWGEGVAVC